MNEGFSIADVMAMTKGEDGFGFGNGAWIWIFFLFFLMGGNGFNRNTVTTTEFADGMNAQDVTRNFNDQAAALSNIRYENLQNLNTISQDIAANRYAQQSCCCETQRAIDGVNYNNAKNTCDIINASGMQTRDIIENNNSNTQRILDFLTTDKIDTLRSELTEARNTIQSLGQTDILLNNLRPFPQPAYITASPYQSTTTCGCTGF